MPVTSVTRKFCQTESTHKKTFCNLDNDDNNNNYIITVQKAYNSIYTTNYNTNTLLIF
jgi:hypothetical protein